MRIAAVNSQHTRTGGAETYLDTVIPALAAAKHQIASYSEFDAEPGVPLIRLPKGAPLWCASEMGTRQALAAVEQWRPDVIYMHGMYLRSVAPVIDIRRPYCSLTAITSPVSAATRCSPRLARSPAHATSDCDASFISILIDAAG
jgi:hypothetical protein